MKTFLLALCCSIALYAGAQVPDGDKPLPEAASTPLTMYATSWCPYCKKARIYFAARGIAYQEVDIEASKENTAEYKQYPGRGVPLFVYGKKRMRGFSEAGMDRFLASTPQQQSP